MQNKHRNGGICMSKKLVKDFSDSVKLEIVNIEGSVVKIKYHTLNDNNPRENDNYIGLWDYSEGSNIRGKAKWSGLVSRESTDGSYSIDLPISSGAYVLGYSQIGDPKENENVAKNLSACAVISEVEGNDKIVLNTSMELSGDSNEVILKYTLLNGTRNDDNWFGVWNDIDEIGVDAPFYPVKTDPKSNKLILGDIGFRRGNSYKIALFANNYNLLEQ